jgi:Phosphatase
MTGHDQVTARLLQGGVAGPHRSHPKEDNILKASQLASGEPDSTFGMPDLATATTEEGLDAVAAVTGAREPGEAYIDPAATIAGVRAASARLGQACRNGATIIVASGHPGPLLNHHARLVEAITAAGGKVIRPLD